MHLINPFKSTSSRWGVLLFLALPLITLQLPLGAAASENEVWRGQYDSTDTPVHEMQEARPIDDPLLSSDMIIGLAAARAPDGADLTPLVAAAKALLGNPALGSAALPDNLSENWGLVREKLAQAHNLANSPLMGQVINLSNAVKGLGLSNLDFNKFQVGLMNQLKPDAVTPEAWHNLLGTGS